MLHRTPALCAVLASTPRYPPVQLQHPWMLRLVVPAGSRLLHLSYHDGEHYNSVRRADDYSPGPPQPITDLVPVAHAGQVSTHERRWVYCTAGRWLSPTGHAGHEDH
jgi:hypothetical protein